MNQDIVARVANRLAVFVCATFWSSVILAAATAPLHIS